MVIRRTSHFCKCKFKLGIRGKFLAQYLRVRRPYLLHYVFILKSLTDWRILSISLASLVVLTRCTHSSIGYDRFFWKTGAEAMLLNYENKCFVHARICKDV